MNCIRKLDCYLYNEKDNKENYPDWILWYIKIGYINIIKGGGLNITNNSQYSRNVQPGEYLILEGGIIKVITQESFDDYFAII